MSSIDAIIEQRSTDVVTEVFRAWRGITWRQWAWASAIAIAFLLAGVVGLLPPLLRLVPLVSGPQPPAVTTWQLAGLLVSALTGAYCFLLAIAAAERDAGDALPPIRSYVVAGSVAVVMAVLIEHLLYVLVPEMARFNGGGIALLVNTNHLVGGILWSLANTALSGGLALAVYVRFRSARRARDAFSAMELERVAAVREVLGSRLEAMRARVEPQFLLGTLADVEALYDHDPEAGDLMLDKLIAYLHAALPQLRSDRSTLGQEIALVGNYVDVVRIRIGERLEFRPSVPSALADCEFPPMLLLPVIEASLRDGLKPLKRGGTIEITAEAVVDRLRVRIADDGLPLDARSGWREMEITLRERLTGLHGDAATLQFLPTVPHGTTAVIEVPRVNARDHR
jgi:hypothetical protein